MKKHKVPTVNPRTKVLQQELWECYKVTKTCKLPSQLFERQGLSESLFEVTFFFTNLGGKKQFSLPMLLSEATMSEESNMPYKAGAKYRITLEEVLE